MKNWIKNLQNWASKWAHTKWAVWAIFFCAFFDACCLPLPTPMFFITLILLNVSKAYKYALFGTLGSLIGATVGYSIGHFAWINSTGEFSALAQFVFNHVPGFTEDLYNAIHVQFVKWDFWILFVASLIPVPYKIFSISSGVFDINFIMFCVATCISQAIKFYALAFLALRIGNGVKKLLEINLKPLALVAMGGIAVIIVVVKVLEI